MFDPNRIQDDLLELQKRMGRLETRVETLESKRGTRKHDVLAEQILEFLGSHRGLRFNSGSLAGNLAGGWDSKQVYQKLKVMVGHGLVKATKEEGISTMYWMDKDES